jgi:exopolysaccharide biosynthesis polyprenyl glycosylphosphotransferase
MRAHGRFTKTVLVVGAVEAARDLIRQLHSAESGLSVVGACVPERVQAFEIDGHSVPVLAEPRSALEAMVASRADAIAIADHSLSNGSLRRLAWELEGTGVELLVAPVLTDVAGPRISVRALADIPLLMVEEPELKGSKRVVKAAFDRALAVVGLVALLPMLLVIGIVVRLTSRGPALFRQVRVGLGGRHFVMWKFRTMSVDAEQRLGELLPLNEHDGVLFKMRHDPRVTRVGRFLRRWSLDELPQLWNVIRGDMSIVGPRPPLPAEVERYDHHVRRRLLVKPGLTGLWQVGGRAGVPWEEAVRLDLYYVENWSLSMDAAILGKTLTAVIRGHGAC